jgi:hypothetical protein
MSSKREQHVREDERITMAMDEDKKGRLGPGRNTFQSSPMCERAE